ncbi:MAG: hypothetical protein ABIR06_06510 [Cyclobacteriaceae bacterium]
MKKYCLLFTILILCMHSISAKIKNGYEKEIISRRLSLKGLHDILRSNNNLSLSEKKKIKDKIKSLIDYISYYELTENLLEQLRTIAPDLYHEIDTIKDSKGSITDVYVKFIPKEQARIQAAGTTSIAHAADDRNTYSSEYGEGTVAVNIWIVSKALWVLSHELGHVKYQVPNLSSYLQFHKDNYHNRITDPNCVGHNTNDPSGKNAISFDHKFNENYIDYQRKGNNHVVSPLVLIQDIRKRVQLEMMAVYPLASL